MVADITDTDTIITYSNLTIYLSVAILTGLNVSFLLLRLNHVQMSTEGALLLVSSLIDCQRVKAVELRYSSTTLCERTHFPMSRLVCLTVYLHRTAAFLNCVTSCLCMLLQILKGVNDIVSSLQCNFQKLWVKFPLPFGCIFPGRREKPASSFSRRKRNRWHASE